MTATSAPARPVDPTSEPDVRAAADGPWAAVELVAIGGAGVLLAVAFGRVFAEAPLFRIGLVAAGVAIAVHLVGARLRWRPTTTLAVSAVVAFLAAAPAIGLGGPQEAPAVLRDLLDGPRAILSLPLPVVARPSLLIVVFAAVWLAVAVAAEARRSDHPFAPVLPLAVAAAVPVLLGAGGPVPSMRAVVVSLGVVGVVVVAHTLARPRSSHRSARTEAAMRRRTVAVGAPLLAAAVVAAAVVGSGWSLVGGREPLDRRAVDDVDALDLGSPLAQVDTMAADPEVRELFTATGPPGARRWRIASLDAYDGVAWSASGSYAPAPPRIDDVGDEATATFEVTTAPDVGRFLPVPGRAVRVEGIEVRRDPRTGNLVAPGDADSVTYRVEAVPEPPAPDRVRAAERAVVGVDGSAASQPVPITPALAARARSLVDAAPLVAGSGDAYRQISAVQSFLGDDRRFRLAEEPRSGESLAHLSSLVLSSTDEPALGSQEQYVAAFAVLLRSLGFAARPAVGVVVEADRSGTYRATTEQVTAWVEVQLDGLGWVAFDVGPGTTGSSSGPEEGETTTTPASTPVTVPTEVTPSRIPETGDGGDGGGGPWTAVLVAAAVLAVVGAAALLARRSVRRARRRRGTPLERFVGAWDETVDALERAGAEASAADTGLELVTRAATVAEPATVALVDELAAVGASARWSGRPVPDATADRAWEIADRVRRDLPKRPRRGAVGDRSPLPSAPGPSYARSPGDSPRTS